jgi:hypothetical protein
MTLSIMTLSITILSVTDTEHYVSQYNHTSITTVSTMTLNMTILSMIASVTALINILKILRNIMLSVSFYVAMLGRIFYCYTECRYAEWVSSIETEITCMSLHW